MKSPLDAMIQMGVVPSVTFPSDSRYFGSTTQTYTGPDGQMVSYLHRRFVPQPGPPNFSTMATHTVTHGDRLDLIAAKYYGDPLMAWLICDANGAMSPEELVATPGRVLNITLPQGTPGIPGA
jgi:hypothetical protein